MPVEIILVGWCIVVGAVMYHVGKRKGWSECEHYFIAKVMVEHDLIKKEKADANNETSS